LLQWHALDRAEQAKYYEMARKEKDLHMQLYPGWSARDNYAMHQKKKKRKKSDGPSSMTPTSENKSLAAGKFKSKSKSKVKLTWNDSCKSEKFLFNVRIE
jgi:hypothetical protein